MRPMKWMMAMALCAAVAIAAPAVQAKVPGPNGRIVFTRSDPALGHTTYTVKPNGDDLQQLFSSAPSEWGHWSPDGRQVSIFCCDDGMAAHIVDFDSGS